MDLQGNNPGTPPEVAPRRRFSLTPKGGHTAFSASLLLMASTLCAGLLGLVRNKVIAHLFGASSATDAYVSAFELPDIVTYLLIGGVGSTAFVTILSRYKEQNREQDAEEALSAIFNVVLVILAFGILIAEFLTPLYVRYKYPGFQADPAKEALCIHLTRILLPGQLFFFAGSVFGAPLLVRKIFSYQAWTTNLYYLGIIFGGLLFSHAFGIESLAIGALAGSFFGVFLTNFMGARRLGLRWRPIFAWKHPAVREWLRLSLPLILGQSFVTTDTLIRSTFASHTQGAIAHMNFARQLFNSPMNMLGPAAGLASLPFFASLWNANRLYDFSNAVNRAVTRLMAVSILMSGWMMAVAIPLVELTLRGGSFGRSDTLVTAQYFTLFSFSLLFWTSQNLYARAFYGAGNTLTPMIAGTVVTVLAIALYYAFSNALGLMGLVLASDCGIFLYCCTLAILLHKKRMVSIADLAWKELVRVLVASIVGWGAAHITATWTIHIGGNGFVGTATRILLMSLVWLPVIYGTLRVLGSSLPAEILRMGRSKTA